MSDKLYFRQVTHASPKDEAKGSRVQLYVPAEDLKAIDAAAAEAGQSRSAFMVAAALERARYLRLARSARATIGANLEATTRASQPSPGSGLLENLVQILLEHPGFAQYRKTPRVQERACATCGRVTHYKPEAVSAGMLDCFHCGAPLDDEQGAKAQGR